MGGAAGGEASRARSVALGALRNVAACPENKRSMWENAPTQKAVIAAAKLTDDELNKLDGQMNIDGREAREHAMAALRLFAVLGGDEGGGKSKPLWAGNEEVVAALAAGAQLSTHEEFPSNKKARDY